MNPAPVDLSDEDRRLLVRILEQRFTREDLQQLAAFELNFPDVAFANRVDFTGTQPAVAGRFVLLAEQTGRLRDLVEKVRLARPNVREAIELAARVGVGTADAATDPNKVRYAAGQFNGAFDSRRRLLDRLQMLKELHDVLHQLQRSHGTLATLAVAARQPGYDPLDAGNTPDMLNTWLALTDSDDRRKGWVTGFVRAVRAVAGCLTGRPIAGADVDRELELLRKLPADEQAELNGRLVETAGDLDTDGLGEPLGVLRTALGPSDRDEFAARYDEFRDDCDALRRLIGHHNLCQEADEALTQAAVLVRVPTGVLPDWAAVRGPLAQLPDAGQPDTPVGRLVRMVDRLAVGGNAPKVTEWLTTLRAAFDEYFYELDADLLDATDRVLRTADVLDFRLRGYAA